ncbi:MAG: mechanosensitive ion channel [Bacteroidales bacterium]|nr:mechanosensitive ion channel [Bacteroidales bacterium]MDD3960997.1 mechanosensitive ion channel [Bacteroidales bacterium]
MPIGYCLRRSMGLGYPFAKEAAFYVFFVSVKTTKMVFPDTFTLSFSSILWMIFLTTAFIFLMYGLQKLKKKVFVIKIFSPHGANYLLRTLQFFAMLWFLAFISSFLGIQLFEFLRTPIIDTTNFRLTPYTFIILFSEFLLVFILRHTIHYFIRRWQHKRQLPKPRLRTLFIVLEIVIWGAALLVALSVMDIPIRTFLAFPLIITKENKAFTIGNAISIILVLTLTNWVLSVIQEIFLNISTQDPEARPRKKTMFKIFQYFVWVIIIILSLDTIGVKISVLIASSAALFVGIGLGLQEIFKDLISGIFLHFEKTLLPGDVIESKGMIGEVKELGIRTTKILTRDNIFVMVPNHYFITEPVINWSHHSQSTRFSVEVGVAYGSDVSQVKKILQECAKDHEHIATEPLPFVRFNNFGNSSLDFQLFFWTERTFIVENIKSDIRFKVYKAFAEANIQIPFPQQDVYIKEYKKQPKE